MPIDKQPGDRAADDLRSVLEKVNREHGPVLKDVRNLLNRWTRAPVLLTTATDPLSVNWKTAVRYGLTLDVPLAEVVFVDPVDSIEHHLLVQQMGGGNTIGAWPSSVLWVGAAAPTVTATAGRYDLFRFYWTGEFYVGSAQQNIG